MAKVLKNKYNSTGERCVDACLSYGELRYVDAEGSPMKVEIPCDKYQEAISDFEERVSEGITHKVIDPNEVLKSGSITYAQAKTLANEGKIKGLDFFEIDGSVECEHILGISASVEYALSLWNGDSRDEAISKSIIRAIKVYGESFISGLSLDNTVDEEEYKRFAKNVHSVDCISDIKLYKSINYGIDNDAFGQTINEKKPSIKNVEWAIGTIGAFALVMIVQILTDYGQLLNNNILFWSINIISIFIGGFGSVKISKLLKKGYAQSNNHLVIDMFNEELERVTYDNLLTKKEYQLILQNITKGEVSKLLIDMKGSVNKKISITTLVAKETKFILDARKTVILPSEYEIKEMLGKLVRTYKEKLNKDYNIKNV